MIHQISIILYRYTYRIEKFDGYTALLHRHSTIEARGLKFRKDRDCITNCLTDLHLFFAYAKSRFSHDVAHNLEDRKAEQTWFNLTLVVCCAAHWFNIKNLLVKLTSQHYKNRVSYRQEKI